MTGKTETVNHPAHYTALAGIEPIDIAKFCDFCTGNIIKYILRAPFKGSLVDDLKKAAWYAGYLSEHPGVWSVQFEPRSYRGFRAAKAAREDFKGIYSILKSLSDPELWKEWGEAYMNAPEFEAVRGISDIGVSGVQRAVKTAVGMLLRQLPALPAGCFDDDEGDLAIATAYFRRVAGALDFAAVHAEVSVRGAADAVEP
nr:MAG TPA: nucelotide kinase [Caudoviricetes sp.]